MKYRLTEDWLEYKKGHVVDGAPYVDLVPHKSTNDYRQVTPLELSLLLKTGILEEVKEEEWPVVGNIFWYVDGYGELMRDKWEGSIHDEDLEKHGNIFRTESEAKEASEKIKTLLLSLKK